MLPCRFWCGAVGLGLACVGLRAQEPYWRRETAFAPPVVPSAFVLGADGKVTIQTRTGPARLNADGSLDPTFSSPLATGESVEAFGFQPSGKLLLRGNFREGQNTRSIMRLHPDGARDETFQAPTDITGEMVLDETGKFVMSSGSSGMRQRYTPDGGLDPTFQAAASQWGGAVRAVLTDGSVLLAPSTAAGRGPRITRLLSDGSTDTAFAPELGKLPTDGVFAIIPLPDGRALIIGGDGAPTASARFLRLLRLTPGGVIDFACYVRPDAGMEFQIAGVLLDLLREAGGTRPVSFAAELFPSSSARVRLRMAVHPSGRLLVQAELALLAGGAPLALYSRTAEPGPSFDRKPVILREAGLNTLAQITNTTALSTVVAGGLLPLSYQWYRDGAPLPGATGTTLSLQRVQPADAGVLTVIVSNAHGTVTSAPIRLTVDGTRSLPLFSANLTDRIVAVGETVKLVSPTLSLTSAAHIWTHNGVRLADGNDGTLTLTNVQLDHAGVYQVSASVPGFSNTAAPMALHVRNPVTGYYEGRLGANGDGGHFMVLTNADRTATLLAYIANGPGILVAPNLRPGGSGTFMGSGLQTGAGAQGVPRTVVLTISAAGGVTGTIDGPTLSLTGSVIAGSIGPHAGWYPLRAIASNRAETHVVVAPGGRVRVFSGSVGWADVGSATVGDAGEVRVLLSSGTVLEGTANADTGLLAAGFAGGPHAGRTFAGLRSDLPLLSRLSNIATRGRTGPGADALIAGFVIAGSSPLEVLVRGIGPSLADFGVAGVQEDPSLFLFAGGSSLSFSENWGIESLAASLTGTATRVGAFPLSLTSRDAVVREMIQPAACSAEVRMARGAPGVALVEIYESSVLPYTTTSPRLVNLSTRGRVGDGDGALIAGFVIKGNAPRTLLIRGVGPGLTGFGVTDVLADPVLAILADQDVRITNDDWDASEAGPEVKAAAASVGAFPLLAGSRDAALLVTLLPGNYTAQISAKASGSGVALVEVYEVP